VLPFPDGTHILSDQEDSIGPEELSVKPLISEAVVFLLMVSSPLIASLSGIVMTTPTVAIASTTNIQTAEAATTTTNFLTNQNATYGIKIEYPSEWLYKESNASSGAVQSVVTFLTPNSLTASGKSLAGFTIAVQSLPFHNLPLNTYTILNLNNLRGVQPGFHLLMSNDATLAGGSCS
jgi:hypothetical protein